MTLFTGVGVGTIAVIADTVSDSDTVDVTAVVPGVIVNPPSGGGGGTISIATIVISGTAFPNAKLTLLKDGSVSTTLIANPDGSFRITLNNLSFGNYQLSLFSEDPTGQKSAPQIINVPAFTTEPYVYSGIVLPPTLSSSSLLVEIGKSVSLFGYTASDSSVDFETTTGVSLGTVTAGSNGLYRFNLTANLPPAIYSIIAKASLNGSRSQSSQPIRLLFYKGNIPNDQIPEPPIQYATCVDYNNDRHVGLVDFSILLFWFGKSPVPSSIDCNGDKVINIIDFSILMYFWTG